MGWADSHITRLQAGETVEFRPRGNSMTPLIESGQLVTVEPCRADPKRGDIVLCRVAGAQYLHLVIAAQGDRFQIGNSHGRVNGWTSRRNVYGLVTKVR